MLKTMRDIPALNNPSPWARGFNDWLCFGDKANAVADGEPEFAEYERGKRDGEAWFNK